MLLFYPEAILHQGMQGAEVLFSPTCKEVNYVFNLNPRAPLEESPSSRRFQCPRNAHLGMKLRGAAFNLNLPPVPSFLNSYALPLSPWRILMQCLFSEAT